MTITEFTIINGCSLTTVQTAATFDACCREHDGQCRKTRHMMDHTSHISSARIFSGNGCAEIEDPAVTEEDEGGISDSCFEFLAALEADVKTFYGLTFARTFDDIYGEQDIVGTLGFSTGCVALRGSLKPWGDESRRSLYEVANKDHRAELSVALMHLLHDEAIVKVIMTNYATYLAGDSWI